MTTYPPQTPDAAVIADLANDACTPLEVGEGLYLARSHTGAPVVVDLDGHSFYPRRKRGHVNTTNAADFADYVNRHDDHNGTEVWADSDTSTITAVLNAHMPTQAGWGDHTATLRLLTTPAWERWRAHDRTMLTQLDFAEFVEDNLPDFLDPTGADMLELAQSITAHRTATYQNSRRLRDGQTAIAYLEEQDATAGRRGDIAIPDRFTIGVRLYEGIDPHRITARFRYRLRDGQLAIGYLLDRPDDIQADAFGAIVAAAAAGITPPIWRGTPS